jgi:predicted transcriptional regulator
METEKQLLEERKKLDQKLFEVKNQKVLSEIAFIDEEISNLQQQKRDAIEHRNLEDPQLLEQMDFHDKEKSRLKNLYFANSYKITDIDNKINNKCAIRREVDEKLACISEESNN